jgi:hypothetical protein
MQLRAALSDIAFAKARAAQARSKQPAEETLNLRQNSALKHPDYDKKKFIKAHPTNQFL